MENDDLTFVNVLFDENLKQWNMHFKLPQYFTNLMIDKQLIKMFTQMNKWGSKNTPPNSGEN